jgi:hypothetical protein
MSRNNVRFTYRPVCLLTLKQNWFAIAARYVVVTDYNQFTLVVRLYLQISAWNFILTNVIKSAHNALIGLRLPKQPQSQSRQNYEVHNS